MFISVRVILLFNRNNFIIFIDYLLVNDRIFKNYTKLLILYNNLTTIDSYPSLFKTNTFSASEPSPTSISSSRPFVLLFLPVRKVTI